MNSINFISGLNKDILKLKARDNEFVAYNCVTQKYYDSAINRFYYHLYLNILVYLLTEDNKIADRHSVNLSNFLTKAFDLQTAGILDSTDYANLKKLFDIMDIRHQADYSDTRYSEPRFSNDFKRSYDKIRNVLVQKVFK